MGLFKRKIWCFKSTTLSEKVPQQLIKIAARINGITKDEAKDVKAVLCTGAKEHGSFIISTSKNIVYVESKSIIYKANRYSIQSLSSITIQNKKALMYLVLTIGGAQSISTDIYGELEDLNAFIAVVEQYRTPTNNPPIISNSPIDEIREYKKLMDEGIITQEEFEAKKKQLLGL